MTDVSKPNKNHPLRFKIRHTPKHRFVGLLW